MKLTIVTLIQKFKIKVYEYKFNERFNGIKRNFPKTDNQKVNNLKVYSPNAYADSTIKESKKTTNIMLIFKILIQNLKIG